MQIDLFTLAAQIVNFLVLLGLLRYFLYDRILEAMDTREERIASRLEEAEEKRQSAEDEKAALREQREQWAEQRERRIREAREEVDKKRTAWLDEAREEVDAARSRWMDDLEQQRDEFLAELRRRIGEGTLALARRALAELADADLEEEVIEAFLGRLEALDEEQRKKLTSVERWSIRSAFDLSKEQQQRLIEAISEQVGGEGAVEVETSEELVAGIEIRLDGETIAWNLSEYLDRLEEQVREALRDVTEPRAETPPADEEGEEEPSTDGEQAEEAGRNESQAADEGSGDG